MSDVQEKPFNPSGRLKAILDSATDGEADALKTCLLDDSVSSEWIAGVLSKHGKPISASTVREQRRKWKREAGK